MFEVEEAAVVRILFALLLSAGLIGVSGVAWAEGETTYAERLGWDSGDRVVIIHVDDAGMSHDSNLGAMRAIEDGVANSMSVMMPCGWVPELVAMFEESPGIDAGLHLTLTSEWDGYRWGPILGPERVPGLVDEQGALWGNVAQVVENATADEVEAEIRAQIARARTMGFEPTHMDSHMGTLFATDAFLERYIKVGAETKIPIMFPGGHNTALRAQYRAEAIEQLKRRGEYREGMDVPLPENLNRSRSVGEAIWAAGLPVLDDLHNTSYGWHADKGASREAWTEHKVKHYVEALRELKPGLTMMILHATETSENFPSISTSGPTRQGDLDAMRDPRLAQAVQEEGLILATWREVMERRLALEE